MFSLLRKTALPLLAAAVAIPPFAPAQNVPAPPAWQDGAGARLDSAQGVLPPATQRLETPPPYVPPIVEPDPSQYLTRHPAAQTPLAIPAPPDGSVQQAVHHAVQAPATPDGPQRRLAPPSPRADQGDSSDHSSKGLSRTTPTFGLPWASLTTTLAALGIVVGLFLICMWLLRRGTRPMAVALPPDVVSVLGRVPLAARQVAQLLRVGNKLVLVSLTPSGAETLTEVTDPAEVDRLVGLCQQSAPHSTTKAFEQVFRQLSREPAPAGFLGHEAPFGPTVTAFDSQRA